MADQADDRSVSVTLPEAYGLLALSFIAVVFGIGVMHGFTAALAPEVSSILFGSQFATGWLIAYPAARLLMRLQDKPPVPFRRWAIGGLGGGVVGSVVGLALTRLL